MESHVHVQEQLHEDRAAQGQEAQPLLSHANPPMIHDLLRRRRSPRAFANRPVAREQIHLMLEAARWAPSAFNEQPWRFVVATQEQPEAYERLLGTLNDRNAVWARRAPLLILSVAKLTQGNTDQPNTYAFHDVGLAVGNLLAQATALGLVAHQMGGFDAARAREAVGIPAGFAPVAMIAVGYPGDAEMLPEDLRARERAPRTRKPLSEIVSLGYWSETQATDGQQVA